MSTESNVSISYGTDARQYARRRVINRLLIAALICSNICFAMDKWAPNIPAAFRLYFAERHCMNFVLPTGRIVIENDPAAVARMLIQPGYEPRAGNALAVDLSADSTYGSMMKAAEDLADYQRSFPAPVALFGTPVRGRRFESDEQEDCAILFLHERRATSTSPPILVTVTSFCDTNHTLHLQTICYDCSHGFGKQPTRISSMEGDRTVNKRFNDNLMLYMGEPGATGMYFRIFAGIADPNDLSKFTIVAQDESGQSEVHGQLQPDGTVQLILFNSLGESYRNGTLIKK